MIRDWSYDMPDLTEATYSNLLDLYLGRQITAEQYDAEMERRVAESERRVRFRVADALEDNAYRQGVNARSA